MPGRVIYTKLSAASAVTDIVSTRIYPAAIAQEAAAPAIVYSIISMAPSDTKDDESKVDLYRVQIDCYSNTYKEKETLAAAVIQALNRSTGTQAGLGNYKMVLLDLQDGLTESTDKHRKILDFNIRVIPA